MIKTTIREILRGDIKEIPDECCIYIFRDKEHILYIGRSNNVLERVFQHISPKSRTLASYTGELVWENAPLSFDWQLEFLTIENCLAITVQRYPLYNHPPLPAVETTEKAMIAHYHPCLNDTYNLEPSPLPEHIKTPQVELGLTNDLY